METVTTLIIMAAMIMVTTMAGTVTAAVIGIIVGIGIIAGIGITRITVVIIGMIAEMIAEMTGMTARTLLPQ
jgi:hypothetical protein